MKKMLLVSTLVSAIFMMSGCHLRLGEDETPIIVPQITAKVGNTKVEAKLEWYTGAHLNFSFYEGPDWEITSDYKPEVENLLYTDADDISPKRFNVTFKEPLKVGEISGKLSFHYRNWETGAAGNKSGTLTIKVK